MHTREYYIYASIFTCMAYPIIDQMCIYTFYTLASEKTNV